MRFTPPGDRKCAFFQPQTGAGEMDRHQRRRTCRIHGKARPTQVQYVRHSVCHAAHGRADTGPRFDSRQVFEHLPPVVVGPDTDEDAGVCAGEAARWYARVFQCLPDDLESDSLLRIHELRFPRGHPEELGVESCGIGKEGAILRGVEKCPRVLEICRAIMLPPLRRNRTGRLFAVGDEPPKLFHRVQPARESAAHPNDSDGGDALRPALTPRDYHTACSFSWFSLPIESPTTPSTMFRGKSFLSPRIGRGVSFELAVVGFSSVVDLGLGVGQGLGVISWGCKCGRSMLHTAFYPLEDGVGKFCSCFSRCMKSMTLSCRIAQKDSTSG